ncbi:MAG: rRNA biogenesis protein rrp5 [Ruminococcus flavefaciens]|nr:rRNA biogenesis protein rrp5 [Ruminococcus flavefaciens]
MEPMMKIINALSALTAALQEYTAQTTEKYLDTFEEIYNPETDEPQETAAKEQLEPEPQTVTFIELRSRLSEISRSGHTAEVKELLRKFGADKLSVVAESDYAALLTEAEVL